MYNFRYHLVTICSIFVALAVGLLLGAAVATSDVVESTSDGMVDSMLARYDNLTSSNAQLEQQATENASLAASFIQPWAEARLDGRTIVLLLGNSAEDKTLQGELASNIAAAGGATVSVSVLQLDFGLNDIQIKAALQKIVPEVTGEDYHHVLAKALVAEWSYVYSPDASDQPQQQDPDSTESIDGQPQVSSEASALDDSSGLSALTSEPVGYLQTSIYANYPLTKALLEAKIISISADYALLRNHDNPEAPLEQQNALQFAEAWHLPYNVNGLIDGLALDAVEAEQIGLHLALSSNEAAANGQLIYPSWLKSTIPKSDTGNVALPNYYTLLVQPSYLDATMEAIASENSLSCVSSPSAMNGSYSIIALLSGAQAGIYGPTRPLESRFAPLPEDSSGRAIFR